MPVDPLVGAEVAGDAGMDAAGAVRGARIDIPARSYRTLGVTRPFEPDRLAKADEQSVSPFCPRDFVQSGSADQGSRKAGRHLFQQRRRKVYQVLSPSVHRITNFPVNPLNNSSLHSENYGRRL